MGWLTDAVSNYYGNWANAYKEVSSFGGLARNDVSKFFEDEQKKQELRGAEFVSALSGVPVLGNIIQGINGINQMEDLYARTGKVSEYGTLSSGNASGLGKGIDKLPGKIERGTHDLFEHYAGSKDDTIESLHEKGIMKYGDEI